jgi:hypothetical protein
MDVNMDIDMNEATAVTVPHSTTTMRNKIKEQDERILEQAEIIQDLESTLDTERKTAESKIQSMQFENDNLNKQITSKDSLISTLTLERNNAVANAMNVNTLRSVDLERVNFQQKRAEVAETRLKKFIDLAASMRDDGDGNDGDDAGQVFQGDTNNQTRQYRSNPVIEDIEIHTIKGPTTRSRTMKTTSVALTAPASAGTLATSVSTDSSPSPPLDVPFKPNTSPKKKSAFKKAPETLKLKHAFEQDSEVEYVETIRGKRRKRTSFGPMISWTAAEDRIIDAARAAGKSAQKIYDENLLPNRSFSAITQRIYGKESRMRREAGQYRGAGGSKSGSKGGRRDVKNDDDDEDTQLDEDDEDEDMDDFEPEVKKKSHPVFEALFRQLRDHGNGRWKPPVFRTMDEMVANDERINHALRDLYDGHTLDAKGNIIAVGERSRDPRTATRPRGSSMIRRPLPTSPKSTRKLVRTPAKRSPPSHPTMSTLPRRETSSSSGSVSTARGGSTWSDKDTATLMAAYSDGLSFKDIQKKYFPRRSVGSCHDKWYKECGQREAVTRARMERKAGSMEEVVGEIVSTQNGGEGAKSGQV